MNETTELANLITDIYEAIWETAKKLSDKECKETPNLIWHERVNYHLTLMLDIARVILGDTCCDEPQI
jgi:hypothetical protein